MTRGAKKVPILDLADVLNTTRLGRLVSGSRQKNVQTFVLVMPITSTSGVNAISIGAHKKIPTNDTVAATLY